MDGLIRSGAVIVLVIAVGVWFAALAYLLTGIVAEFRLAGREGSPTGTRRIQGISNAPVMAYHSVSFDAKPFICIVTKFKTTVRV